MLYVKGMIESRMRNDIKRSSGEVVKARDGSPLLKIIYSVMDMETKERTYVTEIVSSDALKTDEVIPLQKGELVEIPVVIRTYVTGKGKVGYELSRVSGDNMPSFGTEF